MKISVILPVLNESENIAKAICHLQQYGADHLAEIIVVDGGSSDQTVALAKAAGANVYASPLTGRAAQLEFGVRQSKSDILYFVHADTLPPKSFAAEIGRALQNGYHMGNFQYDFDSSSWLLRINAYFTRFRWFFTLGGDRTFFIRKQTYQELGGFDPEYVIMEEYDFLRRAMRSGYDFAMIPRSCIVSARKYEENGWLRVQIANLVAYNLWSWGLAKPQRIREIYRRILR